MSRRNWIEKRFQMHWKTFKITELADKTATSIHHILQRAEADKFNVEHPVNKVRMNHRKHQSLHQYFTDERHPQEQLRKHFELCKQVINKQVVEQLEAILTMPIEDFYRQDLIKNNNKKWKRR